MKRLTKWSALFAFSVTALTLIVTVFDLSDDVLNVIDRHNFHMSALTLCTWDQCADDNNKFIEFISKNVARTVTLDILIEVPVYGEFSYECSDYLMEYDQENDVYRYGILPNMESCFPDGSIYLEVGGSDIDVVTQMTGQYVDRINGEFTVGISATGGASIYRLIRER